MSRVQWPIGPFTVVSYGNGLSYSVTGPGGRSFYLQGDDASDWREQYDAADSTEAGPLAFLADSLADYGQGAES